MVDHEEQGQESEGMRNLRAELKAANEERTRLLAVVQERTIKDAGFDPTKGVVQRLVKDYSGEWDADAFKEFAVAEGLTPVEAPLPQANTEATPVAGMTEGEQNRLATTARLDQIAGANVPDTTPSLAQQLAAAEAEGNWAEHSRLNEQWMQQIREQRGI